MEKSLYRFLHNLAGDDLIEIFGHSGTGKSTLALQVCKDAVSEGKNVLYIDTERNITQVPEGIEYVYIASFEGLYDYIINKLKQKYDVIILDSLGWTILGAFATWNMRQRGEALLKAEAITYTLKVYSYNNNAFILMLNQPESEFGKAPNHTLHPFGDKHIFGVKEVIWLHTISTNENLTTVQASAFRSRKFGRGKKLFKAFIDEKGVKIQYL